MESLVLHRSGAKIHDSHVNPTKSHQIPPNPTCSVCDLSLIIPHRRFLPADWHCQWPSLSHDWSSAHPPKILPLPHPTLLPSYPHSFLFLSILPSLFPFFPYSLILLFHFTALVILGLIFTYMYCILLILLILTYSYPVLTSPSSSSSSLPSANCTVYPSSISILSISHHPLPPSTFLQSPPILREIVLGPSTSRDVQAQWQPG